MNIAIIGGGAAGFMAAITTKERNPSSNVTIYEKSSKVLSKVLVSGGGRCNVTHNCQSVSNLLKAYPRGSKELKRPFTLFGVIETIKWFKSRGVELKIENDNRMFPVSNKSSTIANCLIDNARKLNITICMSSKVEKIEYKNNMSLLSVNNENIECHKLIIATGGFAREKGFDIFKSLGYDIIPPVPSLFTFNITDDVIKSLMGISVENATCTIQGKKLKQTGPILITHWGFSGPAILKLSAYGANLLSENNYDFSIHINWLNENEEIIRNKLINLKKNNSLVELNNPFKLPKRLWKYFLDKNKITDTQKWLDIKNKQLNKLINTLVNDEYKIKGKTTFKEEFVTCGGINLKNINMQNMESKLHSNIYFAGEVLNIDAITGGFNFQAAWTTGFLAGNN